MKKTFIPFKTIRGRIITYGGGHAGPCRRHSHALLYRVPVFLRRNQIQSAGHNLQMVSPQCGGYHGTILPPSAGGAAPTFWRHFPVSGGLLGQNAHAVHRLGDSSLRITAISTYTSLRRSTLHLLREALGISRGVISPVNRRNYPCWSTIWQPSRGRRTPPVIVRTSTLRMYRPARFLWVGNSDPFPSGPAGSTGHSGADRPSTSPYCDSKVIGWVLFSRIRLVDHRLPPLLSQPVPGQRSL